MNPVSSRPKPPLQRPLPVRASVDQQADRRDSSHEFAQNSPPPETALCPLPESPKRDHRPMLAKAPACSVHVIPPDYDGLLHNEPAGLLHPATSHGVRCVSERIEIQSSPTARTLRSISLPGSRTVSPQPMPSRRCVPGHASLPTRAS